MTSGKLVLVGTPIGNLGDITLRAIDTLKSADLVAAEDTRRTRALLTHLGIQGKRLVSLDAHASERELTALLDHVEAGETIAFVTDAGMPSTSDPGSALVRAAALREVRVTVVPGPSAVSAAIALSGLIDAAYAFAGFLPRQGQKRRAALEALAKTADPVVLFEAGNRTQPTLADLSALMPLRPAAVCRELTKLHEECLRAPLSELAALEREWRGEVVIVLGASSVEPSAATDEEVDQLIGAALDRGSSTRDAADEVAKESGRPRREVYARVTALKAERGD